MLREALLAAAVVAGSVFPAAAKCLLPSEIPMVEVQLFFGRDVEGRGPVTDAEWSDFSSAVLAANFPDGFAVSDGEGQWRDPMSKTVVHEQSKIALIAVKPSPVLAAKLKKVMDAYRTRFRQQSVGVITRDVCAAF